MLRQGGTTDANPLIVENLKNRQDMIGQHFVVSNSGHLEVSQIICDGCSGSSTSEVGAGIFAQLGSVYLAELVRQFGLTSPVVGHRLYQWFQTTMRHLIELHPNGSYYLGMLDRSRAGGPPMPVDEETELRQVYDWIQSNLLFTVVASYVGEAGTLTLRRGDGGFWVDGVTNIINYDNAPPYMGYHFFSKEKFEAGVAALVSDGKQISTPPPEFEATFYPGASRIAMFSDGMPIDHIEEIWDTLIPVTDWANILRNKLQKRMNAWWLESEDGEYLLADDLIISAFDLRRPQPIKSVPLRIPVLTDQH
jgi:hypothetical protein